MAFGVLIAIAVFSLLVNSLLLWLTCRLLGARVQSGRAPGTLMPVSFQRALVVTFGVSLLLTAVAVAVAMRAAAWIAVIQPITAWVLEAGCHFLLVLAWFMFTLRLRRGNVFLVALVWCVLTGVTGVGTVLTVKATLMEGFVIPTGAMTPTLYGPRKVVTCPDCGHEFAVNASMEADPQPGERPMYIRGCICPNCRRPIDFKDSGMTPPIAAGDRMLVGKGLLAKSSGDLRRNDLIVFDFPDSPPGKPAEIYVKRLIGLPGETVAIHQGHFYILPADALTYKDQPFPDLPLRKNLHANDPEALQRFGAGKFEIVRNAPELLLQCRHRVYDNDHPAKDTEQSPPRWNSSPADAFVADSEHGFQTAHPAETAWLRYRHLLAVKPSLITDFSGYNSFDVGMGMHTQVENWVGDLILECEVTILQPKGELILELAHGVDRFRTIFDLATGQRRYVRVTDGKESELFPAATDTPLTGTCKIRMANVADALIVWVNDTPLVTLTYPAAIRAGPEADNDLEPASIGVRSASVKVHHLKLWRGNYCPVEPGRSDVVNQVNLSDPATWDSLRNLPVRTFYVQPDHYFVVGDNAAESADSRIWGLVPRNLLLGQPLFVYYPWSRAGYRH